MLCKSLLEKNRTLLVILILTFFLLNTSIAIAISYDTAYDSAYDIYNILGDGSNRTGNLNITFQIRSCDDPSCDAELFVGPDNTTNTYFTNSTLTQLNTTLTPNNQYFQYIAYFHTEDLNYTPMLYNIIADSNSPPYNPTVTLNFTYDNTNYTNESMWCEFNISDIDNEAQMYANISLLNNTADSDYTEQWKLTDLPYSNNQLISFEIIETNFTKNDYVICQVQVCDDESMCSSFVNSSSLKVENYPVKISSPLGNLSNVYTDDSAFVLDWSSNWTDADNTTYYADEAYINWTYKSSSNSILSLSVDNDTDQITITPLTSGSTEINWTIIDSSGATDNETVYWTILPATTTPTTAETKETIGGSDTGASKSPSRLSIIKPIDIKTGELITLTTVQSAGFMKANTEWLLDLKQVGKDFIRIWVYTPDQTKQQDPIQAKIQLKKRANIDLNKDAIADIRIGLRHITSGNAFLYVKELKEQTKITMPEGTQVTIEETQEEIEEEFKLPKITTLIPKEIIQKSGTKILQNFQNFIKSKVDHLINQAKTKKTWLITTIAIITILALFLVISFRFYLKKRRKLI